MITSADLRDAISVRDLCGRLGIKVNRSGFARCPFHAGDRTASLKVYPNERGWYCFGCHAGGDVIRFAEFYWQQDYKTAVRTLAGEFGLASSGGLTDSQRRAIAQRRLAESVKKARAKQAEDAYWAAFDWYLLLDDLLRLGQEIIPEDDFIDLMAPTIELRSEARERLREAEERRSTSTA